MTQLLRSWMFVPGERQRMLDKALGLHVDAIMMDIEDGVAPAEKENARRQIAGTLDAVAPRLHEPAFRTPARYVRVNPVGSDRLHADLQAVVRPGIEGLVVSKVDHPRQIDAIDDMLGRLEGTRHVEPGSVRLLAAIESPAALFKAFDIASASRRVIGLIFGAEDFCREMALPLRREGEAQDLIYARSQIATAAAAAHVQAVDGVWTDLKDMDGLRRFARQARQLGMSGMSLIHPSQIDDVNAAFTPTPEDVAYAKDVLQAFEDARARGEGAIAFRGQLLDYPIVDRARQTVALATSLGVGA
jgi:citrate lyase subunit beta/citryl-CoA lyase